MSKINIIETTNVFGTLNTASVDPTNLTQADKKYLMNNFHLTEEMLSDPNVIKKYKSAIFSQHRALIGEQYGFNPNKMFMTDQKDKNNISSYKEITKEYVAENPKGWTDIDENFLVMTEDVKDTLITMPVADCANLILIDNYQGIIALGHCSNKWTNLRLPEAMIQTLQKNYNARASKIKAYISSCGSNKPCEYLGPDFSDKEVWNKSILRGIDGLYYVNLRSAIQEQLLNNNIEPENIITNIDNTIENANYFSRTGNKPGRHLAGAFFSDCEPSENKNIYYFLGKDKPKQLFKTIA